MKFNIKKNIKGISFKSSRLGCEILAVKKVEGQLSLVIQLEESLPNTKK